MKRAGRYVLGIVIGLAAFAGITACHKSVSAAQQEQQPQGPDPSDQNMVQVDSSGQPIQTGNESQQQPGQYSVGGAPIERRAPQADQQGQAEQVPLPDEISALDELYGDQDPYGQAPIEADQPPPELPVYDQPEAPAPNYIWTPGYWDYAPVGYYWVPGVWVAAPFPGALWTPCYWSFYGGRYRFHHGYWGLHIGFYGGINYGFGYYGEGYRGGYWNGNNFYYNRSINHISPRITNVYVHNVTIVNAGNRVSFNGGRGGIQVRARPAEVAAMHGPRIPPMSTQRDFQRQASQNRQQFFNQNRGRPATVTTRLPVAADKGIQRPAAVQPAVRPGNFQNGGFQNGNQNRPGQPSNVGRPGVQPAAENRPAQPGNVARPGFQGNENHPVQPGRTEVPSVNRPQVQQPRPVPQQTYRPNTQPGIHPSPEAHPNTQPRPEQQFHPQPPQQPRPNVEQPRPQPQFRPETQQPRPHSTSASAADPQHSAAATTPPRSGAY